MMQRKAVDLDGGFEIGLVDWDGIMHFPGYFIRTFPGVDNFVQLVKDRR
jgi:hypothetical protein